MNYQETIDYLYQRLPVFQHIGARAFKPGLQTTRELCGLLGDPQQTYPTIHVGGTNGKGSTSHMLAAILQQAGYRVGLYTSPHLKDFRERIRVNGMIVSEGFITGFVEKIRPDTERLSPSFFEVTVAMAFQYFAEQQVDVAVIEVGMGGRLDSTNIIEPVLSLITNISMDHMQFLGDTPAKIATEKSGIIKKNTPVVISERQSSDITEVFENAAKTNAAPIVFGSDAFLVENAGVKEGLMHVAVTNQLDGGFSGVLALDLTGAYQLKNIKGVLSAIHILREKGWNVPDHSIVAALSQTVKLTGLKGRWQMLRDKPVVYCDTAHNEAGLSITLSQFATIPSRVPRFVIGFVGDKDVSSVLKLFPIHAAYYFCQPSNLRALNVRDLQELAASFGLHGGIYPDVNAALDAALKDAAHDDAIYVGGSTFVVADLNEI